MIELVKTWYNRYFSDPQAIILTAVLVVGTTIILSMGDMLLPVFASIVIAYLLEGVVRRMQHYGSKRITAVILVRAATLFITRSAVITAITGNLSLCFYWAS